MFQLRVNGIGYDQLDVRYAIVDGYPGGNLEVAVFDPVIGEITLTSDCEIEVQQAVDQPWWLINTRSLIELAGKTKIIVDFH